MPEVFEDHGVHFEYPSDWQLEVSEDGPVTTVEVQAPSGLAFALVRTDESCPDPADVADEVLDAMREEYPDLDAAPAMETHPGSPRHRARRRVLLARRHQGATIRCFRTPRRTVLVFGQWSDLGEEDLPELVRDVFRSIEEMEDQKESLWNEIRKWSEIANLMPNSSCYSRTVAGVITGTSSG